MKCDTLIGISGSYDFEQNPVAQAVKKFEYDIKKGSSLTTIPIYRGMIQGIDNLKFMYPLAGIPMIAYTIINAVDQGTEVKVTGNEEIHQLVSLMNSSLELKNEIQFIGEGDINELSISNSFLKLFDGDFERNYFVAGDIPKAERYVVPTYTDDVVIDLNTKRLFNGYENLKRNFYNYARSGMKIERFKEANIYFFTKRGFKDLYELADSMYSNRKGGGLIIGLLSYVLSKWQNDEEFKERLKPHSFFIGKEILKVFMQKHDIPNVPPIDLDGLNKRLSKIYGADWKITSMHEDIFRVLDVDGLNNDWILYELMMRNMASKSKIDPRLIRLREEMRLNQGLFPLFSNFEGVIYEYLIQVDSYLPKAKRINPTSLDDFIEKNRGYIQPQADELTLSLLKAC